MKTITRRINRLEKRKPGHFTPPVIIRQCDESRNPLWATCGSETINANAGESLEDFEARVIQELAPNAEQAIVLPAKETA